MSDVGASREQAAERRGLRIGEAVQYYAPDAKAANGARVQAAVVTRVWGSSCVNLTVFPDCGEIYAVTSVSELAPFVPNDAIDKHRAGYIRLD